MSSTSEIVSSCGAHLNCSIRAFVTCVALVYGGFNYNKSRTVIEMGSMSVTATEHKNIAVPAVVGVVVLIGGIALLVGGKRRT